MKKTVVGVMITAVLLSLGAVQSVAAEKTESWDGGQCAESQCFVDENSDGVCDLSDRPLRKPELTITPSATSV